MAEWTSLNNLRLAWIRTLSGENTDYRMLQRIELDAFGWAEEQNLRQLQRELIEGAFRASATTKVYIPKSSGLLRPITVLRVNDAVVYQAIADKIAARIRRKLAPQYLHTAFSGILNLPRSRSVFFFRPWKYGFKRLDDARRRAFAGGFTWLGELDLASFYDIIDHRVLHAVLAESCDEDVLQLLLSSLSAWTTHVDGLGISHGHGIPQGPLPSSFLAECVLHALDERMQGLTDTVYFRYVDDITVMSKSEKEARRQFGRIEILCRDLGLVPQVKRPIEHIDDIDHVIFDEPSVFQSSSGQSQTMSQEQRDAARRLFLSCFQRGNLDNRVGQLATKLNYSLFRMAPDRRVLAKALSLLWTMPSVSGGVNYFLKRFGRDRAIYSRLLDYFSSSPVYESVVADCLETFYRLCEKGSFSKLRYICKSFLPRRHTPILRATAVRVLGLRQILAGDLLKIITRDDDVYVTENALVALCNTVPDVDKEGLLNTNVRSANPHIAMTSAYLLTSSNLRLTGTAADVNPWATPILRSGGLTRKRVMGDRIGEILKERYGLVLPTGYSFRRVLNKGQYKQALLHLNMAEGGFATNRSLWVTQMDNMNQILLFVTYRQLGMRVSYPNTFGSLSSALLRGRFPSVAAVFQRCHDARLQNPVPHAYSSLLGEFSRDIKPSMRDRLCGQLKVAYQEFVDKT